MSDIVHLPASTDPDSICEAIDEHGGVIVDRLLSSDTLERLETELRPYLDACEVGRNQFAGYRTKRIGALMARSVTCRELAMHPLITASSSQYLAPYCDSHQLHFTQAVAIGRGEGAQQIHRDRGVWGPALNRSVETQFSTIWALTEFTEENGATRFVPGSHTWDKDRHPTDDEIRYAEMEPGSVLLYNGTVLHGGGRNDTADERVGVLLHYTLNWLRQEENQYLSCPPHIAAELPAELRSLMGYSLGGPVLGFYSTPGDPGEGVELAPPELLFGSRASDTPSIDDATFYDPVDATTGAR
ncbi:ectoine hydroxylase-related dioxygenase (phytanoyl-CoA dioxygenase family) [Ilumatobacter fluminis]|uniref:Ectoine hydroxylase-related dioxygenase (Phytanoyl-CoA dioxygenase family) n=1 Tax=Ilumatobacter fluminis TaxID=467091 RepID=A0A4R7I3M6_9ACTN|nr:phytanoyl-CoA dioxygenase family protein [Ilumatobacter fluminis]TDT18191.1 ectoine hydroxylase-related dioxygenase (phytanoyl-CoA dioxygenase family) [Ilumatobacter fluminis]